jgi:hypothetical protein
MAQSRITTLNDLLRRPDASFALAAVLSYWRRRSQRPQETVIATLQVSAAVGAARAFAMWMQNRPAKTPARAGFQPGRVS